jgi:hypothetical protein
LFLEREKKDLASPSRIIIKMKKKIISVKIEKPEAGSERKLPGGFLSLKVG